MRGFNGKVYNFSSFSFTKSQNANTYNEPTERIFHTCKPSHQLPFTFACSLLAILYWKKGSKQNRDIKIKSFVTVIRKRSGVFKGPRNIENGIWISLIIGPNQNQFAKKIYGDFPTVPSLIWQSLSYFTIYQEIRQNMRKLENIYCHILRSQAEARTWVYHKQENVFHSLKKT